MQTRFSFGGDEHIFAEVSEAMSLEAFFKSLFVTNAVRDAKIKGQRFVLRMRLIRSSSIPIRLSLRISLPS